METQRCEFVSDDGSQCYRNAVEGQFLCSQHKRLEKEREGRKAQDRITAKRVRDDAQTTRIKEAQAVKKARLGQSLTDGRVAKNAAVAKLNNAQDNLQKILDAEPVIRFTPRKIPVAPVAPPVIVAPQVEGNFANELIAAVAKREVIGQVKQAQDDATAKEAEINKLKALLAQKEREMLSQQSEIRGLQLDKQLLERNLDATEEDLRESEGLRYQQLNSISNRYEAVRQLLPPGSPQPLTPLSALTQELSSHSINEPGSINGLTNDDLEALTSGIDVEN